jgi:hypothetical protein
LASGDCWKTAHVAIPQLSDHDVASEPSSSLLFLALKLVGVVEDQHLQVFSAPHSGHGHVELAVVAHGLWQINADLKAKTTIR